MKSVSGGKRWNKHAKLRQLVVLVALAVIAGVEGLPKVFRNNEICGMYNGHRVYLELGDRGQLQATNVTFSKSNHTIPSICTLELVTCPSCNFKISLSYSNFPTKCATNHNEMPCRCDYLEFSEPPFDVDQSGRRNCGHDVVYQTQTRSVLIRFLYWGNHSHAFTLEYVAERNRETLQGNPGGVHNLTGAHTRTIMTPYFPSYYPRDFGKEYVLSCNVEACRVNVIFSDFQLAKTSSMEFYDWNGQRLYAISGGSFRPPVVQSSGPSMIIRFYANGGSGLGYRAKVSFLTIESAANPMMLPDSNCGGVVENIGGAITMMNLVAGDNETRIFDCIWLLKPPNTYAHLKTHLSLKIDTFEKMGPNSMLTVVQGTTSDNAILDVVRPNLGGGLFGPHTYVAPLTAGFYVHLRATFRLQSRMALVYTAFSYLDCFMGSEFLCQNRKCIPVQLRCDGFDHCGDGSDEPDSCEIQWETDRIDRRWYSHTPNYYFPKMDRYPDLRTATIIFVASSVGLIMLISALIILLYRTGNRARQQRELQSQLQTISELLDSNAPRGPEDVDEPPVYEAPPDYDEIIKVGMDEDIQRKRRRHSSSASGRRSRMRRSRRPSNVSESNNPILEVRLPPEFEGDGPSTSGMLQVPYASQDQDEENDDLRDTPWMRTEPDFFMSSRIIEAPTSASTSQSYSIGCQTAASGTGASGGTNSSPPPTYDDSQYFSTSALAVPISSGSTSASDNISRGFTEEPPNITLSLAETPPQVTITSMAGASAARPSHIWSPTSRSQRPWLAFSSGDELHQVASATSSGSIPAVHSFSPNYDRSQIFDSIDMSQINEIDAYLLAYGSGSELRSPEGAGSGMDLQSTATGLSHLPSMSSLARNSITGSSVGSNSRSIVSANYDHAMRNCPRCREPLRYHSQCPNCLPGRSNTIPANMCSACGGKISLEENLDRSPVQTVGGSFDGQLGNAVKLCNCFPKFPSQTNIVRSGSANVIPPRPFSADRAEARRSVANLTSNFEAFFNSHIGIPNAADVRR
uniref:CUB domain-containing protein n=1 Tax=Culex tarsalis TaxID=7177 RepID=A0A1Q3FZT1_CULTA